MHKNLRLCVTNISNNLHQRSYRMVIQHMRIYITVVAQAPRGVLSLNEIIEVMSVTNEQYIYAHRIKSDLPHVLAAESTYL